MARNFRKGSSVCWKLPSGKVAKGKVVKQFTAPKGSVNVPKDQRTTVDVRIKRGLTRFSKRPSELRRCK